MTTEVIMPSLGESVFEGKVSHWLKQEGDKVSLYEPILEIETDKVTTEATAEVAGVLLKILVPEGETVEVGAVLAYIGQPGEDARHLADDSAPKSPVGEVIRERHKNGDRLAGAPATASEIPGSGGLPVKSGRRYTGRISPVVGRIAEEHQVDLNEIEGTGRDGRITKQDILAYVEGQGRGEQLAPSLPLSPVTKPAIEPSQSPVVSLQTPDEYLPLSNMRQAIAEHMVRSKHTSPHVTTIFDLDFSAVAAHRSANKDQIVRDGAKITYTVYIVAALVQALKAHPLVNSSWSDKGILLKKAINIGLATAVPDGLIVPVIKNADGLSLLGLARAINDLAERARLGQLKPDEVQGGTFTLTNHGVSGSLFATPIINQPQCGILGIGKIEKRVKVIDDAIAIRLMAFASLTFDHRILDGATADGFMSTFKETLEKWV